MAVASALEAVDLVKTYPTGRGKPPVKALASLSFSVQPGTVFALLGPNGAGKSTTVKILTTLARPDSGTATVAGFDVTGQPDKVRRAIGFVAQKPVTDPMDTGRENLELAGRIHGLSRRDARARATELLDRFDLAEAADRLVKTYSGGMARKLDVALGLVHRPQVLFLDEPTTGLDPQARTQMWREIERLAAHERMTILLTTHYLDEADRLAARLAIIDRGRVVTSGTPDELKSELQGDTILLECLRDEQAGAARNALGRLDLGEVTVEGRVLRARAGSGARLLPAALAALDNAGVTVAAATVARPSLDDVYLKHTGRTFAAAGNDTTANEGIPA
ncbi:ATP-binding cassette domain-containing protein [Skermania sp. ID1734]|nr:ATP-binding cassette domain-containing protein [Skermania sp. ID1734]